MDKDDRCFADIDVDKWAAEAKGGNYVDKPSRNQSLISNVSKQGSIVRIGNLEKKCQLISI